MSSLPAALLAVGGLAVGALLVLLLRSSPRTALVAWVIALFFVPVWVGLAVGVFWAGITLLTVLLLVVNWSVLPLRAADGWMLAFVVLTAGLFAFRTVDFPSMVTAMLEWVIPYIWGRVVLARIQASWLTSVIAVAAIVAALLAIVEFFTSVNPFVLIPGSGVSHETWSTLQYRAGLLRVEGAFGHSIALGAVLAMCSAFVIATRWRLLPKIAGVLILATAAVLTFSRAGLLTLVITVALSAFLLPGVSSRFRTLVAIAGAVGAAIVLPLMDTIFGSAGDEAAGSADYRTDLLVLLGQVEAFGNPGQWQTLVAGDHYLGYFARSIDNALVLMLLRFGYVPTILLMACLLCAVIAALRGTTRNPASLAVAGQLPSLVVVALITQYGMFLWFCVGLAVAWPRREAPGGAMSTESTKSAQEGQERRRLVSVAEGRSEHD